MGAHVSEKHKTAMHIRMLFHIVAGPILFDIEGFCNPCKQANPVRRARRPCNLHAKNLLIQKSGLGMGSKSFVVIVFIFPGLNDATAQFCIRDLQAEVLNPGPRTLPTSGGCFSQKNFNSVLQKKACDQPSPNKSIHTRALVYMYSGNSQDTKP